MTRTPDLILKKFFIDEIVRAKIVERTAWANTTGYRFQREQGTNGVEGGGNLPVAKNCQLWAALLLAQLIEQHNLTGILRASHTSSFIENICKIELT